MFRDRRTGQITIVQRPNLPLTIFLATVVLRRVVDSGTDARRALDWISVIALAWWAVDEVARGVNPWRRLLGLAGIGLAVSTVVRLLG